MRGPHGAILFSLTIETKLTTNTKKVSYDPETKLATISREKQIKIHPSQMKAPRKFERRMFSSRYNDGRTAPNDSIDPSVNPQPGTSGLQNR